MESGGQADYLYSILVSTGKSDKYKLVKHPHRGNARKPSFDIRPTNQLLRLG